VALADDGQSGLEALATSHPDVVVTDLMMPRIDGSGFCRRARRIPGFEGLPIILLTAHPRDEYVESLLELGNIVFMAKPFDAPSLTGALRDLGAGRFPEAQLRAS
ncbi:MAG TPA: response regulator, partial [Candidatus Dormibacteraeota bacterium]|nr:response regulator [Candidatus Dormibacteraeota bacterium]